MAKLNSGGKKASPKGTNSSGGSKGTSLTSLVKMGSSKPLGKPAGNSSSRVSVPRGGSVTTGKGGLHRIPPASGNRSVPNTEHYLRTPSKGERELKMKRAELDNPMLRNLRRKVADQESMFETIRKQDLNKFANSWVADWGRNKKQDSNALSHFDANSSRRYFGTSQGILFKKSNLSKQITVEIMVNTLSDYGVTITLDDKWTDEEIKTIYNSVIKIANMLNQTASDAYVRQFHFDDPAWLFRNMMGEVTLSRVEGLITSDCNGDKVKYSGLTCTPNGQGIDNPKIIYLSKDALGDSFINDITGGTFSGEELILHEFGHVLQYNWNLSLFDNNSRPEKLQLGAFYNDRGNEMGLDWKDGYKLTNNHLPIGARSSNDWLYEIFSDAFMTWIRDDFDYQGDHEKAVLRKQQFDRLMQMLMIDKFSHQFEARIPWD